MGFGIPEFPGLNAKKVFLSGLFICNDIGKVRFGIRFDPLFEFCLVAETPDESLVESFPYHIVDVDKVIVIIIKDQTVTHIICKAVEGPVPDP